MKKLYWSILCSLGDIIPPKDKQYFLDDTCQVVTVNTYRKKFNKSQRFSNIGSFPRYSLTNSTVFRGALKLHRYPSSVLHRTIVLTTQRCINFPRGANKESPLTSTRHT